MELIQKIHAIEGELYRSDVWKDNPQWGWIRNLHNNHKGAVGERIVDIWAKHHKCLVEPRVNVEHDRIVSSRKHEIKLATLANDLKFKYGHIRMNYDWDVLTLIGVWPNNIRMWQLPKANVEELFYSGNMCPYKKDREEFDDILVFDAHDIPHPIAIHEVDLIPHQ